MQALKIITLTLATTFLSTFLSTSAIASTLTPVKMCVFDIIGASGMAYKSFKEFKTKALKWGVDLELKLYTDDRIASEEFKNGVCDMVNLPGMRTRQYNSFTGTINAIGALPTYKHLNLVINTLSSKKAAKLMRQGEFEVMGIAPIGGVFMFVNDRSITSPKTMTGKRFAVLDDSPESEYLIRKSGMTPVSSTIMNSLQKFNNHSVDIVAAPALAFEPLELYKGLEPNGGIFKAPFLQATMQIVGRWKKFPEGFGQHSRELVAEKNKKLIDIIVKSEQKIPSKYWIDVDPALINDLIETNRESRIALRDKDIYNGKALRLFRKVRCKLDANLAECTAKNKE